MSEMIYAEFFVNGEKFTVEDYGETGYALYCEDSVVTELFLIVQDLVMIGFRFL